MNQTDETCARFLLQTSDDMPFFEVMMRDKKVGGLPGL